MEERKSPHIPAEAMSAYRRTARERWLAEQRKIEQRRKRAWELANKAARLLKEKYAVYRVVVFGSLLHEGRFTLWSDVDLAAWGLTDRNWLKAMSEVRYLSDEIEINLVDVTCCSLELLAVIEREGKEL
ncbi:MAG: nucleotidyltransferase domain-containing protein [Candidatus Methanomethyliaceae archaeon]